MITEVIHLNDYFPRVAARGNDPTLTAYIPDGTPDIEADRRRPSIIVCPGGGYTFVSDREGEPVALAFAARGYNAFVLKYSVAPAHYPTQLAEAAAAAAMDLAGETAEALRLQKGTGNATFRIDLIDAVFNLTEDQLTQGVRYEIYQG